MSLNQKASRNSPEEIDEYLSELKENDRIALENLREFIKSLFPEITERIAFDMPVMRLKRDLVAFAAYRNHLSFYTMSPNIIKKIKPELNDFKIAGTTIHFKYNKPIPESIIETIIRERIKEVR